MRSELGVRRTSRTATRSPAARQEILDDVAEALALPDDQLREILEADGIPLPLRHPSVDDCRHVLGLAAP
jgi:hypothetical protein